MNNPERKLCTWKEFFRLLDAEVYAGENPYFAGLELGHPPTPAECEEHHRRTGALRRFVERNQIRSEQTSTGLAA